MVALALCGSFSLACATPVHAMDGVQTPIATEFRAVGYDPLWLLEVDGRGVVRFSVDGENADVQLSAKGLILGTRSSGVVYGSRTDAHELLAEIAEVTCLDAVSGSHLTHTVTIRLDAREYRGCGRGFKTSDTASQ